LYHNSEYVSGHSIFYRGLFYSLIARHYRYIEVFATKGNLYLCPNVDVAIFSGCPPSKFALDANKHVPMRVGDESSAVGFFFESKEPVFRFWRGYLGGMKGKTEVSNKINFLASEYLFQGVAQLKGMSGGPVVNGIGYTGLVHGNYDYSAEKVSLAFVIPFDLIVSDCISKIETNFRDKFSDIQSCPETTILTVPEF